MLLDLSDLRENYASRTLEVTDVNKNPIFQFKQWLEEALSAKLLEPNAMTLSTCNKKGEVAARIVLLKAVLENGFVFYTNYNSEKAHNLSENPNAALTFNWLELHRQIRIQGTAQKISTEASTSYFQSRPKSSQIGAWASPQSQVIEGRDILLDNVERLKREYANEEVLPRPEHWGGFMITPYKIEFWQGRPSRLHDRIRYRLEHNEWIIERLAS